MKIPCNGYESCKHKFCPPRSPNCCSNQPSLKANTFLNIQRTHCNEQFRTFIRFHARVCVIKPSLDEKKGQHINICININILLFSQRQLYVFMACTVKLQIFVRYLFSYFRLETGSYVLIFVLSRVCEENDVEIQWLQSKKKFSYDIKFRTFSKVRNVRK